MWMHNASLHGQNQSYKPNIKAGLALTISLLPSGIKGKVAVWICQWANLIGGNISIFVQAGLSIQVRKRKHAAV